MNAELVIPIENMTVIEKMKVIDHIMDDLSRNAAAVPVIDWHGDLLRRRAEAIDRGEDVLMSLEDATARIRRKTGRE